MAAPPHTTRTTPTGFKMPEGYKAVIAFSRKPAVQFWEMTVKPGGFAATEINTTTQHNVRYQTMAAGHLIKVQDVSGRAAYDPDLMDDIAALTGDDNGGVTVWWPDGSYTDYWAFLKEFDFQELQPGQFPMANYAICVTNWDKTNSVEVAPVTVKATGT